MSLHCPANNVDSVLFHNRWPVGVAVVCHMCKCQNSRKMGGRVPKRTVSLRRQSMRRHQLPYHLLYSCSQQLYLLCLLAPNTGFVALPDDVSSRRLQQRFALLSFSAFQHANLARAPQPFCCTVGGADFLVVHNDGNPSTIRHQSALCVVGRQFRKREAAVLLDIRHQFMPSQSVQN